MRKSMSSLVGKDAIRMFGLKDGLSFLIRWDIIDPIKMWYWEKFKTRQWCTWAGWYCDDKDCKHTHLERPPREEDYPIKEKDICDYCGNDPAVTHIWNPNHDTKPYYWKVCKDCKEVIPLQEQQTMNAHMMTAFPTEGGRAHAEKQFRKSNEKIAEFEKRTKKKTLSMGITVLESGKLDAKEIKSVPKT